VQNSRLERLSGVGNVSLATHGRVNGCRNWLWTQCLRYEESAHKTDSVTPVPFHKAVSFRHVYRTPQTRPSDTQLSPRRESCARFLNLNP
jgi:hypothetical protein